MKTIPFAAFLAAALAASLLAQQPTPTPPPAAPPVCTPKPGMKWEVAIKSSTDADASSLGVITGMQGAKYRGDMLAEAGGKRIIWVTSGSRIFLQRGDDPQVREVAVRDSDPEGALSHFVTGLPGIHWVGAGVSPEMSVDPASGKWIATYKQEPAPFKMLGEGENAVAIPTGPTVGAEAVFDAQTGIPLFAKVGGKFFQYRISLTGGTDPELPPALRAGIEKKLRREAALQAAIRKQEGGR
jgi:hypothetical protein